MKIDEERSKILKNYQKLYNTFTEVNDNFDHILKRSHFTKSMLNTQEIESPLVDWMNSNKTQRRRLLVTPEQASSVNITKVVESAEFIGRLIPRTNAVIEHLEKQRKIDPKVVPSTLVSDFKTKAENSKQISAQIQEQAPRVATEGEKRDALLDYYRSLADASISSRNYSDITAKVGKQRKNSNLLGKVWDKIKDAWENIRRKIDEIIKRIKGLTASVSLAVLDSLAKIKESLKHGKDQIVKAFTTLSDKFHDFIIVLIDQMFQFLTRFSDVAKKQGYSVSNIDVTVPSVRFEFVPIFFVSIPIPVIDPPDITVSITKDK